MASKVMVKLPVPPFSQVNKSKAGTVSSEVMIQKYPEPSKDEDEDSKTPEQVRLEQNIKFLQDQHQLMLTGLQGEIEKLKTKNRELQFQLIFGKAPIPLSSPSPSSPEEESSKHKVYTSPRALNNTTPLQVELLEKELGELKIQMTEQESRNVYLSAIVDEQKKQLERYDRRREKEQQRTTAPGDAEVELLRKLEDAETLIRQLRRENSDLRRENQDLQSEPTGHGQYREQNGQDRRGYRGGNGRGHRGGNNGGHSGHNNGYYNSRGGWFPPVHTQNFWQGGRSQHQHDRSLDGPNLPELPPDGASGPLQYHHHQGHHGRKGPNNNHHYQNGEGRKYRGGHNNHKGSKPS